jgi:glutamate-1-semialdehyde aminotransferase
MKTDNIKVGDQIKFNSPTRSARAPAVRVVTGRDHINRVTVRYHGYGDFIVYDHEIISHTPKSD